MTARVAKRTTIEGVLTKDSGSAGDVAGWAVTLDLKPWREVGAEWEKRQLRVSVRMAQTKANRLFGKWRQGECIRVEVGRVARTTARYLIFAFLADGFMPVRRIRLSQRPSRERADAPVQVDSAIGRLRLDRGAGWYGAWRGSRSARYEVAICTKDPDDVRASARQIVRGGKLLRRAERSLAKLRNAAARKLLALYNQRWRQTGPALSKAAFARRLKVTSIVVDTSGQTDVLFNTDNLFADHVVEVRIAPSGRLTQIALAG